MTREKIAAYHVQDAEAGLTLVAALRRWRPGESWNKLRALVHGCRVQINGNLCLDDSRRLVAQDVVRVLPFRQNPPPADADVKIRHVDEHVVVVEKPSGMTTLRHTEERNWPSRRKQRQATLDEVLPRILAKLERPRHKGRRGLPRIRPVHRLDRDTSGLMVFARTSAALRNLVQQFRRHAVHRRYLAVVRGDVPPARVETYLVRDRGDGRRGSDPAGSKGQRAVTHVRPLEKIGDYTFVECRLETGRTHQIRIHLSEHGWPVCGEKVYTAPAFKKPAPDTSGAPRLALHAAQLGFVHPVTGQRLDFAAPLPDDLQRFLARLRKATGRDEPARHVSQKRRNQD